MDNILYNMGGECEFGDDDDALDDDVSLNAWTSLLGSCYHNNHLHP